MTVPMRQSEVRLTDAQIHQAKNWQKDGLLMHEIAAKLGVQKSLVEQTLYWDVGTDGLTRQHEAWKAARGRLGVQNSGPHIRAVPDEALALPEPAWPNVKRLGNVGRMSTRWREILSAVCKAHRVSVKEVVGRSRYAPLVAARHEAMWRMWQETRMSTPMIGKCFGRDHATVLHALRKMRKEHGE